MEILGSTEGVCGYLSIYSVLHVRLESKSHEKLFVHVMCDVALQCHSETLNN